MFTDNQLLELREKQKNASKQYREKQKLMQQERTIEFNALKDENQTLSAENRVLREHVQQQFLQLTNQISSLTLEVHALTAALAGKEFNTLQPVTNSNTNSFANPPPRAPQAGASQQSASFYSQVPPPAFQHGAGSGAPSFGGTQNGFDSFGGPGARAEQSFDITLLDDAAQSNHGLFFAFVLLLVLALPACFFPRAAGGALPRAAPRLLGAVLQPPATGLEPAAAAPAQAGLRILRAPGRASLDALCREACRGRVD